MRTLLINNYDSYADLLAYALAEASGTAPRVIYNDQLSVAAIRRLPIDAIVLSPGPGQAQRTGDFGVCAEVIATCDIPILGVCLGHQGIAHVCGGKVVLAPRVRHGKASWVQHEGHPLFAGIPSPFPAMRYHSWVVDEASLPPGLRVLARAQGDGTVMALGLIDRPVVGVQFHPESVGTPHGRRLLKNFFSIRPPRRPVVARLPVTRRALPTAMPRPQARAWVASLPWCEPEIAFGQLYRRKDHAFWLDSAASGPDQRWSLMGAPNRVLQTASCATVSPFAGWRQALSPSPRNRDEIPGPFCGGLLGYAGYELQRFAHDTVALPHHDRAAIPDGLMMATRRFVVFDHHEHRAYACSIQDDAHDAQRWLKAITCAWSPRQALDDWHLRGHCPPGTFWPTHLRAHTSRNAYLRAIEQAQRLIGRGETYEVCLTNAFATETRVDPWQLYRTLRRSNPAPYAAYLKTPHFAVLSASPERFMTLRCDRQIITEPIKGTRAYDGVPDTLAPLRAQLANSAKDRAELMMVVDLLRNDLARVAKARSIAVPHHCRVSAHPTVVQLSSVITAALAAPHDAIDLLHACFPGGSITGAPKRRTMEIIHALEQRRRGVYTGAIGYFSSDGTMDFSIAIRTMVHTANTLSFGAGGAITTDSNPVAEYEEVRTKAFALVRAIELTRYGRCGEMRVEKKT